MPNPTKLVNPLLEGLLKPLTKLSDTFNPIRTFHASPHDFEAVDLSKVGSGQGAQMYGHGFYSAESPQVSGPGGAYWREFSQHPKFDEGLQSPAMHYLQTYKFDREKAAQAAWEASDQGRYETFANVAKLLRSGEQVGPRVYETHLYARPEDFLDWDKPLSEQSKHVRGVLGDIKGWQSSAPSTGFGPTGEDIYKGLTAFSGGMRRGQRVASETLADAGIPGMRYLDQFSRRNVMFMDDARNLEREIQHLETQYMNPGLSRDEALKLQDKINENYQRKAMLEKKAGDTTYNYVTTNPDIIDLAKKLAVPGVLATGAAPYLSNAQVETRY